MDPKERKHQIAVELGSLGGAVTKKKGKEYFANLSKLGVEARKAKREQK